MTVEQELVALIRELDGQDFDGEVHLTSADASRIISALSREGEAETIERCAKVAEQYGNALWKSFTDGDVASSENTKLSGKLDAAREIASAIRHLTTNKGGSRG